MGGYVKDPNNDPTAGLFGPYAGLRSQGPGGVKTGGPSGAAGFEGEDPGKYDQAVTAGENMRAHGGPAAAVPAAETGAAASGGIDFTDRNNLLASLLAGAQNAPAPQSANATLAPFASAHSAALSPAQQAAGVTLSPAAQAAGVAGPSAGRASAGSLGPAATSAESSFRGNQQDLINQLTNYATGKESVSQLNLAQAAQQNIASQMAMAAGARPGMGGLAQRAAAQNAGNIQTQLAQQSSIAGLQEREAAANQLQALLGTARGQDLSNNQFNAGQQNQQSQVGAQLGTQASIANAGNQTQASIAGQQLAGQLGMFNAGQSNQQSQAQAQLAAQLGMFNAGQGNAQSLATAQLAQQNSQFNAGAQNAYGANAAQLQQQGNQFNVGAQLQQTGLNQNYVGQLLGQQLGTQQLQQQGSQFGQTLAQNQQQFTADLQQRAALEALRNDTQLTINNRQPWQMALGGGLGGAATLLPFLLGKGGDSNGGQSSLGGFMNDWGGLDSSNFSQGGGGGGGGPSLGGFAGGAASGAAMGSAFGPWGAAAGGVIGGIASLF